MDLQNSGYLGQLAALGTMHGKELVISPVFEQQLGISVEVASVDTDSFGTFAGETPRTLSQLETVRAKATLAAEVAGLRLGIASEGTIGPHPLIPFTTSDFETVAFVDLDREIFIYESYRSSMIRAKSISISEGENLEQFLNDADFPNHGLIVRNQLSTEVIKGITKYNVLLGAIKQISSGSEPVVVENDHRANFSPTRMANIETCTKLLTKRIFSKCPDCSCPGWGKIEPIFGAPCSDCGQKVESVVLADRFGCVSCDHQELLSRREQFASPAWCPGCNP